MQKFNDLPKASVAMNGFDVYKTFLAIQNHFDPKTNYDFVRYRGKTKINSNTLSLKQKMLSEKIGRKFKKDDLIEYFVSSFLHSPFNGTNCRFLSHFVTDDAVDTYLEWRKDKYNYSYLLQDELSIIADSVFLRKSSFNEMFRSVNNGMPPIVNMAIRKHIRPYTLVVLESLLGFMEREDKKISDPALWPNIKSITQRTIPFYKDREEHKKVIRKYMETM